MDANELAKELYEIQEWVLIMLSLASLATFLMRFAFEKQWVCLTKAIPRLLLAIAYTGFQIYIPDVQVDLRGIIIRYVLTWLLVTDLIYNAGVLWEEFTKMTGRVA